MFNISSLTRENIKNLLPYSSARDEFSGTATVFLDANENSLGSPLGNCYQRYPDPHQFELKEAIGLEKNITPAHIFLGNGSDECIDILYRCFCNPGKDNVIICPPTYGMYEVSAHINDVELRKAVLLENFQLDTETIGERVDDNTKMIWICSPNNPTGNSMEPGDIKQLAINFNGLIVVDEAYIDFAEQATLVNELSNYPNLVVLQTFSKARGLAALRLGMAFASEAIIDVLNKVKPPYNISGPTQQLALKALGERQQFETNVKELTSLRTDLKNSIEKIPVIERVYCSDANFLLAKVTGASAIYAYLLGQGIVIRNRSNIVLCDSCLRITVGTAKENELLVAALINYSK